MKIYPTLLSLLLLFIGCASQKIDIGDIIIKSDTTNISLDRYISFTQEFFENREYTVNRYCQEKRALLTQDKFSTQIYLKVINRRTKKSTTSEYPIWFLINDDSLNIFCVRRSANFIPKRALVVNAKDKLTLQILQKNQEQSAIGTEELKFLLNLASFIVPYGSNFLLKKGQEALESRYLNAQNSSKENGYKSINGVRTKEFDTTTKSIKIELIVPTTKNEYKNLGYILLRPIYQKTLSTVEIIDQNPNFRYIFSIQDPQIKDIMDYKLDSLNSTPKEEILKFKNIEESKIIDGLNFLNMHLINNFTSYDRALILTLALRETKLYSKFKKALENKNVKELREYIKILNQEDNPLHSLSKILKDTNIEYYTLMYRANRLLEESKRKKREEKIQQKSTPTPSIINSKNRDINYIKFQKIDKRLPPPLPSPPLIKERGI